MEDEWKKGKELHAKMMGIAPASEESLKKLEGALSKIEEEQSKKELAQFEKDKGYSYWFRAYNFESKKLLGVTDTKVFFQKFASVDKSYEQLKAFSDKKGDSLHVSFKSYIGQAERFHSNAKKLGRSLNEAEPNPQEIENLRSQVTSAYNSLVSISNSLRELEANNILK